MNAEITRPVIRYHGSKYRMAAWIVSHFPPHLTYVEPFGGSAAVLLRKQRVTAEVYNDLDQDVVGLFRVLRDPERAEILIERLKLTPFARDELRSCYEQSDDPIESARRLIVRSFMGFGADSATRGHKTGFRSKRSAGLQVPAYEWSRYPESLRAVINRLQGVTIENRDWRHAVTTVDSPDTLAYLDPPYLGLTHGRRRGYNHELASTDEHIEILEWAVSSESMVVISGYDSELYADRLDGWVSHGRHARTEKNHRRIERIWIKPNTAARQEILF